MTPASGPASATAPPLAPLLALLASLGILGLASLAWPAASWVALALYVAGSLALLLHQGLRTGGAEAAFLAGAGWRASLAWGLGLGTALAAGALVGMGPALAAGAAGGTQSVMVGMAGLLLGRGLLPLLPLLVVAEEVLWRGLLPPVLLARGLSGATTVAICTVGYALVHLAVAPVPWEARWALAAMALPLGLLNGGLTLATGSLWGAVALHLLVMGSMVAMLR